ncbi:hypothetical protein BBH99_15360 [Chryseobacterium contaminans]|uniref:Uncharacterized protein n=1 Tax=Chryseobacterium contaminans TaxID=1423959 RepID=A0A1M7IK01_9FLAO|nr:hypothetical protein [Chryseobacterium contaminans]OCA80468.1 hypothetical protein BBH99_15360 [Chryseobacterium contaminans]SHM41136.1 hypothetical protein SAMN05444407_11518 [Chryseobacterium contaminans]
MKKRLSLITIFIITAFHAQSLKNFAVPKGYNKVTEIKGDLDKDGENETVLVFDTDQTASDYERASEKKDYKRVFYILKNEQGQLKIWKENSKLLYSSGMGFYPDGNILNIQIKNNCMVVEQQFSSNSRHTQTSKHTFRFQNGDFYLIGSYDNFADTCEFNFTNEINFSTGKVIIDRSYSSCDDDNKNIPENFYKEFNYKLKPLIKMDDYKMGEHKFKIPGLKEDFVF